MYQQLEMQYKKSGLEGHSKGKLCAQADVGGGMTRVKQKERGSLEHIRGIMACEI